jgi:hypothetical protein
MGGIVLFMIEKMVESLQSVICGCWRKTTLSDLCMQKLFYPFKFRFQLFDEIGRRHHVLGCYHSSFYHYPEI